MKQSRLICAVCLLLALVGLNSGQRLLAQPQSDTHFDVTVDKQELGQDELLTVEYILRGPKTDILLANPQWPDFSLHFTVENEQIRLGQDSLRGDTLYGSFHMRFMLRPKEAGEFPLGRAEVNIDDRILRTGVVSITVTPVATSAEPQSGPGKSPGAASKSPKPVPTGGTAGRSQLRPVSPAATPPRSSQEESPDEAGTEAGTPEYALPEPAEQLPDPTQLWQNLGDDEAPGDNPAQPDNAGNKIRPPTQPIFFVDVTTDKTEAVINEPITYRHEVYVAYGEQSTFFGNYQVPLAGVTLAKIKPPDYQGFVEQTLDDEGNQSEVRRNGQPYLRVLAESKLLFPSLAKTYTITASDVPYEDSAGVARIYKTKPVKIVVKPFPPLPANLKFDGAVGDFKMVAQVDRRQVSQNETVTLTVEISGQGNIRSISAPNIPPLADAKTFEPQVDMASSTRNGQLHGAKTFRYLIIPQKAGEMTIPSLTFTAFSLEHRQYRTMSSEPIRLSVKSGPNVPRVGVQAEDAKLTSHNLPLQPIKLDWHRSISDRFRENIPLVLIMLLFPPLFSLIFCRIQARREERRKVIHPICAPEFQGEIEREIRQVRAFLSLTKTSEALQRVNQLYQSLWLWCVQKGDASNVPENFGDALRQQEFPAEFIEKIGQLKEAMDRLKFMPGTPGGEELEEISLKIRELWEAAWIILPALAQQAAAPKKRKSRPGPALLLLALALCGIGLSDAGPANAPDRPRPKNDDLVKRFQAANQAFLTKRLSEARGLYEAILQQRPNDPTILFNLGNTWFELGQPGRAILMYERARKFAPRDPDIAQNLAVITTSLQLSDTTGSSLNRPGDFLSGAEFFCLGLCVYQLYFLLFIFSRLIPALGQSPLVRILRVLVIFTAFDLLGLALLPSGLSIWQAEGVLVEDHVAVRIGPNPYFDDLATVRQGNKVELLEQSGEWIKVRLANGQSGWIKQDTVERM